MIIGITGCNGSGKGEVAEYLKKLGYQYLSLSDIIREETAKKGLELNRDNLIQMGNEIRQKYGASELAKRTISKITGKRCVIDSIRNLAEIQELRKQPNFLLIGVDAPVELRYNRIVARGKETDKVSFEDFQRQEELENFKSSTGQQLKECMKVVDKIIINDGSMEKLHDWVDRIIVNFHIKE